MLLVVVVVVSQITGPTCLNVSLIDALQAATSRPTALFHNSVIVLENKMTRQPPRRHPTLLTDYLKAVASKESERERRGKKSSSADPLL